MNQTETSAERRGEGIVLLAVFLLSVLLRFFFANQRATVSPDGAVYGLLARKFLDQGFYESLHVYWSPLYPTLTGVFGSFIDDLEQAGKTASVFCGAALIIPVYLLGKRFYGRRVATFAAMLVAFYPPLIESSSEMLSEALYTLIFACMILFGWSALTNRRAVDYATLGASLALLYLTRTEAYLYVFVFVLLSGVVSLMPADAKNLFLAGRNCAILLGTFFVIASAYLAFVHDQTGRWSFGLRGVNVCYAGGTRLEMHKIDALMGDTPKNLLVAEGRPKTVRSQLPARVFSCLGTWNLDKVAKLLVGTVERLYKVYRTYQPTLLPALVIFFAAVGLVGAPWDRRRLDKEVYLSFLVLSTILGYSIIHVIERYLLAIIPVFLVWASAGILRFDVWGEQTVLQSLGYRLRGRWLFAAAGALALLLSFLPSYYKILTIEDTKIEAVAHKETGVWSARHLGEGLVIMSTKPYVAFYGKGRHLYLPNEDYSRIMEYAQRKGVDVLVVDDDGIVADAPQLEFLLDESKAPDPLVPVYKNTRGNKKIILYKIGKSRVDSS